MFFTYCSFALLRFWFSFFKKEKRVVLTVGFNGGVCVITVVCSPLPLVDHWNKPTVVYYQPLPASCLSVCKHTRAERLIAFAIKIAIW